MDVRLSRSGISRTRDPHGWNSYDNYGIIHAKLLEEHPFLDVSQRQTIAFNFLESDGVPYLRMQGRCYCKEGVILRTNTLLATRYAGRVLQVRGVIYRYIARIPGKHLVLKYHNRHRNRNQYIHRAYNPETGEQILYEELTRSQFPVFSEVLDEAELLTRPVVK